MENLKKYLEDLAERRVRSDNEDFNAMDCSGGNFDDAYGMGCEDGETILAQTLLEKFFKKI